MLVIGRREGESVRIGDNVEVVVLDVAGGQVKLGIAAPKDVVILRREVYLTQQQNALAAGYRPDLEFQNGAITLRLGNPKRLSEQASLE